MHTESAHVHHEATVRRGQLGMDPKGFPLIASEFEF